MVQKMSGPAAKFDQFVGALADMHEALAEQDIFSAFHAGVETLVGTLALLGFVVARNGQTTRLVAQLGNLALPSGVALSPTDWLIGGAGHST